MNQDCIKAVNLLADQAEQLPDSWTITLEFQRESCAITLTNGEGEEVVIERENRECGFLSAVRTAITEASNK